MKQENMLQAWSSKAQGPTGQLTTSSRLENIYITTLKLFESMIMVHYLFIYLNSLHQLVMVLNHCPQAHAKVWHTYDSQWRHNQNGNQVQMKDLQSCHKLIVILSWEIWKRSASCCRFGGDFTVWRLGRASGHYQPEGHRGSWEICPVLHGLVCYTRLPWRLPSGHEGLHRYI